jgi:hypothetical protein
MGSFGNFAWGFGFGFEWILIGIVAILLLWGVMQLNRFSFKDGRKKSEEQETFNTLKQEICAGKISLEEFGKRIQSRT